MGKKIELLDCTLRDGSYINLSNFGDAAISGIISKMEQARVDIIECGWLKDSPHEEGSAYYHVPSDLEQYLSAKSPDVTYAAMIDWDRYDVDSMPACDGKSLDAIRVVFPHGRQKEGISVGAKVREKGYRVFFQAANTMSYSDDELVSLARDISSFAPESLSVVDTFGAMYFKDLERVAGILDAHLDEGIKLGFHSHNNQQLSFALTMRFIEMMLASGKRDIVADASLCGMGRGAGNTTTELLASYLVREQHGVYDLNAVLDAIDMYMEPFKEKYSWGYSTPYFISGMFQCHVNNVAYLLKNHRTNARDMRNVLGSLSEEERRHYDYDLLESKFLENQDRQIDDTAAIEGLKSELAGKEVLLVAPGKTISSEYLKVSRYIEKKAPVVIGVNAIEPAYSYDYLFFAGRVRYDYAQNAHRSIFESVPKILLSNVKNSGDAGETVINFNRVVKRGWDHFDNAVIFCLRMLAALDVRDVAIAGFDGFKTRYNESYADASLPTLRPQGDWEGLNEEILDMFRDFKASLGRDMQISFVTESIFDR